MGVNVYPLSYQSGSLNFSDWVSVLTICLAPLIVHMVAGAPKAAYIATAGPQWHDRLGFYNPTSIIWRHYAIFSRRARARKWSIMDVAAANTAFWTSRGWDGGEHLAVSGQRPQYWARLPEKGLPSVRSILQTLVVTIQGVQAILVLVGGTTQLTHDALQMVMSDNASGFGVNFIFSPMTILGILRFFPAWWLSEEHDCAMPGSLKGSEQAEEDLELMPLVEYASIGSRGAKVEIQGAPPDDCFLDGSSTAGVFGPVPPGPLGHMLLPATAMELPGVHHHFDLRHGHALPIPRGLDNIQSSVVTSCVGTRSQAL